MTSGQRAPSEGGWARHPSLAIDLSNTIEAPAISGVQRVALGLTHALSDRWPVALLDGRDGTLAPADVAARARLRRLDRGHSGRTVLLRAETRWRQHRPRRRRPLREDVLFAGDVLLDLEPSWHAPQPRVDLLPRLAARSIGTAAVVNDVLPITHPEWFPPASVDRFASWFDAHVAAGSTLVAISAATADHVAELAGRRPAVIRLGRTTEATPVPTDEPRSGLLMVGTVEPRKGHGLVLDALDLLGADAPVVDVVGRPGWAATDLLHRLELHPKIRWHRDASDQDLHELWRLTGLLLQPSLGEGYGLPVAEALQRGVAVAASDLPVLHEVTDGQATHLPADPAAWADVIAAFSADPDAWPIPAPRAWPSWADAADDLMTALRAAGMWPDLDELSR